MWQILLIMITTIFQYIINIFRKGKKDDRKKEADGFVTPPRAQSRASSRNFISVNERTKRINSHPKYLPSRLPKTFPLTRNPSQISLLGSAENKGTPFRPQAVIRNRGSTANLLTSVRRDDLSLDFRDIPSNRSSNLNFQLTAEDLSNNNFHLVDTLRKPRIGNERTHSTPDASTAVQRNIDVRGRRFNSVPKCLPSRLTESCPPLTTPSQISLSGLNKGTPFKARSNSRTRGSSTNLRNSANNALDFSFLESGNKNGREDSLQDYHCIPAHKNTKSSFEFHAAEGNEVDMQLNELSECCDGLTMRNLQLRSNPHSAPGCTLPHKQICSKIPIRNLGRHISPKPTDFLNFPQHQRGKFSLPATMKNSCKMLGFQEKGDSIDAAYIKSNDIGNWITFRNDTSMKFERIFRSLSKTKHHSTSNMIDASSHAHWLRLAGIAVDKDAVMFKNFAGGKVVLTFGEYKFLIHKICLAHDLDYWDVLRKMATFQEENEELHQDERVVF